MAVRTKQHICDAFISLLENEPVKKITVQNIVDQCNINRNTFYYHFEDIPALIEYIVEQKADELIARYPSVDSVNSAMLAVMEFAEQNRKIIRHVCSSADRALFELHLWRICEYVITEYGKVIFKTDAISEEDRLIILHAYEDECFGKVMGWINRGMKTDERERLIRFLELRSGVAEMMLNRAKNT